MKRMAGRTIMTGLLALTPLAGAPGIQPRSGGKALPAGVVRGAAVEGISEYRFANGLRVLIFPDPSKPTITVNITYLVGSRHENYGETGMAHLLEHMLFKGTPRHPDVPKELTERGARSNGQTSFDRTNYFETFQATDENLRWALDLEADRMLHSLAIVRGTSAADRLKTEMTVVRNEYEAGENSPGGVLYKRLLAVAFDKHNYGNLPIGTRSDIENVDIGRLQAFYRTYYQPDNAVLLISGRIDEGKTLAAIQGTLGRIPKPARVLPATYTVEPVQDGEREVVVRRAGDVQLVMSGYHVPSGSDPDFAPIAVLSQVLADTPSGRLHKQLVESKRAVAAFGHPLQLREPSYLVFGIQLRPDAVMEEGRQGLLSVLEDSSGRVFTAEEVERAKQQLLKEVEMSLNDSDSLGTALSDSIALGDWRLFFLDRDRIKAVAIADVERVAKAYLKPSNRTLALFLPTPAPDRAEIPPMKDVAAMVKDYRGQADISQGEAFDTAPAALDARIVRVSMPSGLKLAMLPRKTRGGSVHFRMVFRLGDETSLAGKTRIGELAVEMLLRGTARNTRSQLADHLDRLKAKLRVDGLAEAVVISGETNRINLSETMGLVAELLKESTFPEQEFEQMKQEFLAGLELERSDPSDVAYRALMRHLDAYPAGHPRHEVTLEEEIEAVKAVTVEDVRSFHRQFFGASSAELAFLGDLDPKEIQERTAVLFGDWRNPVPYVRMRRGFKEAEAVSQVFQTPDKANAFFAAGLNLPLQDTDPDYPALLLGDFMLGGGFLNSRLATRIRQKEGLSYSVGSDLQAAAREKAGRWMVYAIHAPQNGSQLEAAFRDELGKVLREGFSEEEVRAAKRGWAQEEELRRARDEDLVQMLGVDLDTGRTFAHREDLERRVLGLSREQILEVLRRRLDPTRLSIVKAGDFRGSASAK